MEGKKMLAVGNALLDMEFAVEDSFLYDQRIEKSVMELLDEQQHLQLLWELQKKYTPSTIQGGGSAANTAVIFAQLRGHAEYCCRIADDDSGRQYQQELRSAGVICHPSIQPSGHSGKCLIMVTPDAERTMGSYLGVSVDLSDADIDYERVKAVDFLYLEGYLVSAQSSYEALSSSIAFANRNGVRVALSLSDPSMPTHFRDRFLHLLAHFRIDMLFCNEDEACILAAVKNVEQAADILSRQVDELIVTRGREGVLQVEKGVYTRALAERTQVVDTNGAGDAFAGAYLYGRSQGENTQACCRLANRAGAAVVSQYGARLDAVKASGLRNVQT